MDLINVSSTHFFFLLAFGSFWTQEKNSVEKRQATTQSILSKIVKNKFSFLQQFTWMGIRARFMIIRRVRGILFFLKLPV